MAWSRVKADIKLAFHQDMQSDPTLTDLQKRMISTIATHWDNVRMAAECSRSFIAAGAGTVPDLVKRYTPKLLQSGRVFIVAKPTHTTSTLWGVNWWLRGSAWVRHNNGGQPIPDIRKVGTSVAQVGGDQDCAGVGTKWSPNSVSKDTYIGAPDGARPDGGAQGRAPREKKENPHRAPAGFAKWKIVHAEYTGEDEEMFVAHLRSGASRRFVLRCHIDSEAYGSIDAALNIDGDAAGIVGGQICMSTNRSGAKTFLRAGPLPWIAATVLSGEDTDRGAEILVRFDDDGSDGALHLTARQAAALAEVCGGEAEAVGARIRYRLMPDDSLEFRRIA